jgi:hypothetical protein
VRLVEARWRVQSSLAADVDRLPVFGDMVQVTDFVNQTPLALPQSLKGWEYRCVARLWGTGRSPRWIAEDIEGIDPPQFLLICHLPELRWHGRPTECVECEGQALKRRVHLEQDRCQVVLRFRWGSDTRLTMRGLLNNDVERRTVGRKSRRALRETRRTSRPYRRGCSPGMQAERVGRAIRKASSQSALQNLAWS